MAGKEKALSTRRSTSEPFQNVFRVNLVGFVVACERVHDQIDAATQSKFALARASGNQWIKRATVCVLGPRRREIVRGDDDRRNTVASARGALSSVIWVGRGQRLDPGLANLGAANDAVEQIERLGQDVVVRNRLQFRHVDPLQ